MIICKQATDLRSIFDSKRREGKKIGFVPTMGALHRGHISLIEQAKKQTGYIIASIFINPTQFNDPGDFTKYPVTIEKDIYLLEEAGADVLYIPKISEMYPGGTNSLEDYDLGYIETILEGKYRPGHFQGVCQVMSRFVKMIDPDILFMGQKDYQQCLVVKRLLTIMQSSVQLITCSTVREEDGLAMSSRNLRLSTDKRTKAVAIYQSLLLIKNNVQAGNLEALKNEAKLLLEKNELKPDYVEIADAEKLLPLNEWDGKQKIVALVAAYLDEVRLIDNIIL